MFVTRKIHLHSLLRCIQCNRQISVYCLEYVVSGGTLETLVRAHKTQYSVMRKCLFVSRRSIFYTAERERERERGGARELYSHKCRQNQKANAHQCWCL